MNIAQATKSIIVVDDDPSVRGVVVRALKAEGFDVRAASSGIEALIAIEKRRFDMMFLDIKMPGMSGFQVLSEMNKKHPDTVVVMLTASTGLSPQELANQKEAFAYLTKPCNLNEVTRVAHQVLDDSDVD